MKNFLYIVIFILSFSCHGQEEASIEPTYISPPELKRISYISTLDSIERDYYLYLPEGYHSMQDKSFPILMHLHGNGERGDGKGDLLWVTKHGPLMEAWVQKRNLPFVIIVPQLHMLGMDTVHKYISQRDTSTIPRRLESGVPARLEPAKVRPIKKQTTEKADLPYGENGGPLGWYTVQEDLINMLDHVESHFHVDSSRVFLTGLSYGGYGTWYMGSHYPEKFKAIAPVAGWGHPNLMSSIAEHNLPVWCFAGGRDQTVKEHYFAPGIHELDKLGYTNYRFTIETDLGHDVWKRVYAGEDLYNWFSLEEIADKNAELII